MIVIIQDTITFLKVIILNILISLKNLQHFKYYYVRSHDHYLNLFSLEAITLQMIKY